MCCALESVYNKKNIYQLNMQINHRTASPGFSAVKLIIVLAVLAAVGAGGYFFIYPKYIAPLFSPYNKLVPDELKSYDVGKNADGFFIYKKDADLEELIGLAPESSTAQVKLLDAAMGFYNSKEHSGAIMLAFSSKDVAQLAMSALDAQKPKEGSFSLVPNFQTEQKDNVVIISIGKGLDAFNGPLAENPVVTAVDTDKADSQLILALNHQTSPEITMLLYAGMNAMMGNINFTLDTAAPKTVSMILPAHAQTSGSGGFLSSSDSGSTLNQPSSSGPGAVAGATGGQSSAKADTLTIFNGILTFAKDTVITARYHGKIFSVQLKTSLVGKDELNNSGLVKLMQSTSGVTDTAKIQQSYDDMMTKVNQALPGVQAKLKTQMDQAKLAMPNTDANLTFENSVFKFTLQSSITDIKYATLPLTLGAPQSARNAARMAKGNDITVAVEQFNLENQKYPDQSACLETMTDLVKYFKTAPQDPSGSQKIGDHDCSSGYYYQAVPGRGYIIWSRVEGSTGNTSETPETILAKIDAADFDSNLKATKDGTYYIVDELTPATGTVSGKTSSLSSSGGGSTGNVNTPRVKVKRAVTPQ